MPTVGNPQIDASYAKTLKALHTPGNPVIFANIFDVASLHAVLSLNKTEPKPVKAIATASYAIAETLGIRDEDLTYEQNMAAIESIGRHVRNAGLPLSVDIQDGYGDRIKDAVQAVIKFGAVGANIEDSYPERGYGRGIEGSLRDIATAAIRIRL
jgi:2-methylisocitrate lyase-like PEP mutase family enzyme